jgi:hypothetical protein
MPAPKMTQIVAINSENPLRAAAEMDRLPGIPDNSDVAEFDQVILKGSEIKRLLPGVCPRDIF